MARYIANHSREALWSIGADLIYDYFSGLFKKEIMNEHVHNEWLNAEHALSKCVSEEQKKIVKALAVFLIVNKDEEMPADENTLALATGISNARILLKGWLHPKLFIRKVQQINLFLRPEQVLH